MKICFVETEESEREFFEMALGEHEVSFVQHVNDVEWNTEILSIFVHSHVNSRFLNRHPNVRLVTTRSTGYDHVELTECDKRGITVCFVPSYGDRTVAEHTFALILALSRRTREAREAAREGKFSYGSIRGFELRGKTLGVIGSGKIGLRVIRFARAFEMEIVAYDINPQRHLEEVLGFRYISLDELHVPLTPFTYHMLKRETFSKCRHSVVIVNTARGDLIDTHALIEALDKGIVAGAGLGVIEEERVMVKSWSRIVAEGIVERIRASSSQEEPRFSGADRVAELQALMHNVELIGRPNVVFTPHIAFKQRRGRRADQPDDRPEHQRLPGRKAG